ncbi:MAG: FG-GAP repeat protein [Planctomycetes bacterium]|nr:FG-GAP repeat protein [Planctomycetota bacterium]
MTPLFALPALLAGSAQPALPGDFVRALTFIPCGDANGDGVGDIAIGLPRDDAHGTDAGRVFILSGKDGSVIRELHEGGVRSGFGYAIAGNTDFDGDGKLDLAVAAHRDGFGDEVPAGQSEIPGRIYLYSLGTGTRIRTIEPTSASRLGVAYASALHVAGHLDGDKARDLLVEGRIEADVRGGYRSPLTLLAGPSGKILGELPFDQEGAPFVLGDLTRSGGCVLALRDGPRFRFLTVRDQEPITQEPVAIGNLVARILVDLGDLDHDGISDIAAIGKSDTGAISEDVFAMSWAKREPLFLVRGEALRSAARNEVSAQGTTLDACGAPDIDGDGRGELFVVLPGANRALTREEWARQETKTAFPGSRMSGFAAMVSSKSGQWLWTTFGTAAEPLGMTMFDYGFGEEVRRIMDVDHDGLDDLGVSASYACTSEPYETAGASLRILSSKDGSPLMWIEARPGADPRVRVSKRVSGGSEPK